MRTVSGIDKRDVDTRYRIEKRDDGNDESVARVRSREKEPYKIICWNDGDPANPYNWSPVSHPMIVSASDNLTMFTGMESLHSAAGHDRGCQLNHGKFSPIKRNPRSERILQHNILIRQSPSNLNISHRLHPRSSFLRSTFRSLWEEVYYDCYLCSVYYLYHGVCCCT